MLANKSSKSSSSKRGASRGRGQKAPREIIINPALIYAEREIWSCRFALWDRYHVEKPRQPNEQDRNTRWINWSINAPKSFNGYVGNHNAEFFGGMTSHIDHFGLNHNLPEVLIICGPSGSGKSSAGKIFVQKLVDEQNLALHQVSKWCLQVDATTYHVNDLNSLWAKVAKFADQPLERFFASAFRYLVIDNFDHIPPSSQQHLKKIMMNLGPMLKYLFICQDPRTCMIGYITGKATYARTKPINERDALSVIISICYRNQIGFEREGIKALFTFQSNNYSLSTMIDTLQKVFVETEFVSYENVMKILGKAIEVPLMGSLEAIKPIERCKICTLQPPCQHISADVMEKESAARRKALPRYKDGSLTCPEFARFGHCTMFNTYGHCSLDHPKNIHRVDFPVRRCPQCTIPWPCNHCSYNAFRNQLRKIIEDIQLRQGKLRQLNVPEPPLAFTKHLVSSLYLSFAFILSLNIISTYVLHVNRIIYQDGGKILHVLIKPSILLKT